MEKLCCWGLSFEAKAYGNILLLRLVLWSKAYGKVMFLRLVPRSTAYGELVFMMHVFYSRLIDKWCSWWNLIVLIRNCSTWCLLNICHGNFGTIILLTAWTTQTAYLHVSQRDSAPPGATKAWEDFAVLAAMWQLSSICIANASIWMVFALFAWPSTARTEKTSWTSISPAY